MEKHSHLANKTELTISEFALLSGYSERHTRRLIELDKLPSPYKLVELSPRKRLIVKEKSERKEPPKYKHASELDHLKIIEIQRCLDDQKFRRKNGKPNIKKISETVNEHYWTIKRFIEGDYKKKDENRADKGKCRILSDKEIKLAKPAFEKLYLQNVQGNVQLTIEKVFWNINLRIPERLAYKWAKALTAVHQQNHYFQKFTQRGTPHIIRDLWDEYENFLDCVVADEWKIDEFGVWVHSNSEDYETVQAMAYIVMFIDMKTRFPLSILITPHSTTAADSKKAAMQLVRDWGRPKQWLFENQKTWKNADFLRFIFGIYDDEVVSNGKARIEFMNLDDLKVIEQMNDHVIRSGVAHPESKPIERTFKIIKDEFCTYSPSYSPNQFESRKPNHGDAHPGVTKTFEELRSELTGFIHNDFLDRKRTMFHNRMLSPAHEENKARPKTIRQAFDLAYSVFVEDKVDAFKLAYHYAEKYQRKYKDGTLTITYQPLKEKLHYVPLEVEKVMAYHKQELVAIVDQYNVYHCWLFNTDGNLLCEAKDMRQFGALSKERANEMGKIKRQITQLNRKKIKQLDQLKKLQDIQTFQYEKTMQDPVEEIDDNVTEDYSEVIEFNEQPIEMDLDDDIFDDDIIEFN